MAWRFTHPGAADAHHHPALTSAPDGHAFAVPRASAIEEMIARAAGDSVRVLNS
jgi:hypothetical protein